MSILEPCPDYGETFYSYHGTSPEKAIAIQKGLISVCLGGGELGKGFYTGQYLHEAKSWAFHTTRSIKKNVVKFDQKTKDISLLNIRTLNINEATLTRINLKKVNKQRTHKFGVDVVISKIVGSTNISGCQLKWESACAQTYLNGSKTTKSITW